MLLAPLIASSDPDRAEALLEEAIGTTGAMRNDFGGIRARHLLGSARAARGEHLRAAEAYLSAAELASQVGDRLSVFEALGAIACDLAELGDDEPALLLATWAESHGHWRKDWTNATFPDNLTLRRLRALTPGAQQQLEGQVQGLDDIDAIAFARAQLDKLAQE
jgi:hypothetical protein